MNTREIDIINSSLAGTNLIEASAGTGKTYTISALFLRLILEENFNPANILVVTFTRAATDELRSRIRNCLVTARRAIEEKECEDPNIAAIVKKFEPVTAVEKIKDALTDFDEAAIFTIHGFCQRILKENAFETGSLFDTDLAMDIDSLKTQVLEDYYRTKFYCLPIEFLSYLKSKAGIKTPDDLAKFIPIQNIDDIKVIPDVSNSDLPALVSYQKNLKKLIKLWEKEKQGAIDLLCQPGMSGTKYGGITKKGDDTKRKIKVSALVAEMDDFLNSHGKVFPVFANLEKFADSFFTSGRGLNKGATPPEHAIFTAAGQLLQSAGQLELEMEQAVLYLKIRLLDFYKTEIAKRKKERNLFYFDDLLSLVNDALSGPRGYDLQQSVRYSYKAALVDEFQDTDSMQYNIFSRLFIHETTPLFMIGDPKQAIYGFRGADIFSYLKAANDAENKYTLTKNYRSNKGLIDAVNAVFGNKDLPFVFEDIGFKPGEAAKTDETGSFEMWFFESDDGDQIKKTDAVTLICDAVTDDIAHSVFNGGQDAGEIAVLVRTNRQAFAIKDGLSKRRVPSVIYSSGNVFDSQEANALLLVLGGIAEPLNTSKVKAALSTDIFGANASDLVVDEENQYLENKFLDFFEYNRIWETKGFMGMFRALLTREKVRSKLLAFDDGERRLTSLLHLSELLHEYWEDKKPAFSGLLKWFSLKLTDNSGSSEESQLRLESDELAVKIITVHKSKGLEFPVVYCPFAWDEINLRRGKGALLFHDLADKTDGSSKGLVLDLARSEESLEAAEKEAISESLRLLYVALTRAVKKCVLMWGDIKGTENCAMSYILHFLAHDKVPGDNLMNEHQDFMSGFTAIEMKKDLTQLAENEDSIAIEKPSAYKKHVASTSLLADEHDLKVREFSGLIEKDFGISSFSSMISNQKDFLDTPDRDVHAMPYMVEDIGRVEGIFAFPKGAKAGTFFHEIFEEIDFTSKDDKELSAKIEEKLTSFDFEKKWLPVVLECVKKALCEPLNTDGLSLDKISNKDRIVEMEFYFPVNPGVFEGLYKTLTTLPVEDGEGNSTESDRFERGIQKGFIKGFIDLIFRYKGKYYILDYKSNYLGPGVDFYSHEALSAAIAVDGYRLQYYIYTLALHMYLKSKLPAYDYKKDFGGVYYMFLRGVGLETGVYSDLPDFSVIKALEEEVSG